MIESINKTKSYVEKMRQEGKVTTFDKEEHFKASIEMNKKLEQFRREYKVKDRNSQISASKIILTC